MKSLLAWVIRFKKKRDLNNSRSWKNYLIQYIVIFISTIVIICLLSFGIEKQTVKTAYSITSFLSFFSVLAQNSLVFLLMFSSYYTGRIPVYCFTITNAILLALLISSFKEPSYFLLILPHGVPEFLVFFTLAAFAEEARNKGDAVRISFYKKAVVLYILLIASALIEIYVTPFLFSLFQ